MTPSKLRYPTPCPFAKEPAKTTSESPASAVIGPGGPFVVQTFWPAPAVWEARIRRKATEMRAGAITRVVIRIGAPGRLAYRCCSRRMGTASGRSNFGGAEVGPERLRDLDRAVRALVVLEDRDERASDCERRPVQRMHELRLLPGLAAEADVGAPRLERLTVRAGGDLPVRVLSGKPH